MNAVREGGMSSGWSDGESCGLVSLSGEEEGLPSSSAWRLRARSTRVGVPSWRGWRSGRLRGISEGRRSGTEEGWVCF